ncbi:MAG: hypothetical protein FWG03_09675 [Clostridiales bacterium]|nr:hypothetical protein [Clostridiales bacterium]
MQERGKRYGCKDEAWGMTVGILYESNEWSDFALLESLIGIGVPARLIDMQDDGNEDEILSSSLVVSRVFASAVFRGHEKSLQRMPGIIDMLREKNIPMINPYEAHFYEISKRRAADTLVRHGFPVPKVYGVYTPDRLAGAVSTPDRLAKAVSTPDRLAGAPAIEYPCVIKPDCGGRTNFTYIINDGEGLSRCISGLPDIEMIAEEYIRPVLGYVTRLEVIGGAIRLALKRGIAENGLSAYHLGSDYEAYGDLSSAVRDAAIGAMGALHIEAGSLDIIENGNDFFIIDANSVSNASEDNTEMFGFDLMKETAAYIAGRYRELLEVC